MVGLRGLGGLEVVQGAGGAGALHDVEVDHDGGDVGVPDRVALTIILVWDFFYLYVCDQKY